MYLPISQDVQSVVRPNCVLNLPRPHSTHVFSAAPTEMENLPTPHFVQPLLLIALDWVEYFPAPQLVQEVLPLDAW